MCVSILLLLLSQLHYLRAAGRHTRHLDGHSPDCTLSLPLCCIHCYHATSSLLATATRSESCRCDRLPVGVHSDPQLRVATLCNQSCNFATGVATLIHSHNKPIFTRTLTI